MTEVFIAWGALAIIIFGFYRIRWVSDVRIELIYADLSLYEQLPSYEYMVLHFWVWDVRRFIK